MNALLFFIVLLPVILSGCAMQAAKPNMVSLAVQPVSASVSAIESIHIDPIRLIGVVATPAIVRGEYAAFQAKFPPDLGLAGEFQRYRIAWIGRAVAPSGHEYPIQFVWTGCHPEGGLKLVAIVEGARTFPPGTKTALFSTTVDRAFTLDLGRAIEADGERLRSDPSYRRELLLAHGTPLDRLSEASGVDAMLRDFRSHRGGTLLVPPSTPSAVADRLMRFNPRETYAQKHTAVAGNQIVPSVSGTAFSAAVDAVTAAFTSCQGWHEGCRIGNEYYLDTSIQCTARRAERSQ